MNIQYQKYKYPVLAISVLIIALGIFSYSRMKTGLFPDITFPKIKVIVDNGQQPVDKMMATVTVPLENIIRRTENLDYIRSTTSRGSCEISVFIKWDADVDKARQQIQSLIDQIQGNLPQGINITVEKMNPSILAVMGFSLEGNRSAVDLRKIAQYQIKPYFAATPGIADIAVIGGKRKEYQIIVHPEKLASLGISLEMIRSAVAQSNILESNGYIRDHNRLYLTLTDNAVSNIQELQDLVLIHSPSRLIRLKDVADVELNEAKDYIKIKANGKNVPLIAVMKQPGANLLDVTSGIRQRAEELKKILPADVKLVQYYDQSEFVNDSITSIRDVLWAGLLLAFIVVILFLRSVSTSAVVLITIPVSLCLTISILYLLDYTFNIMTLGAIAAAIGLMIDDAVIVVEQIHRSHEELPGAPMTTIIPTAMRYLLPAMIGSSLSTIVIFFPFVMMSGIAGAYFTVLAYTMVITLSCSFVVSWIILPVLFLFVPLKPGVIKKRKHRPWIEYFITRPLITVIFLVLCAFCIWRVPPMLDSGFLPDMDEGTIVLDFKSPPGTTLEETDRMLEKLDAILQNLPEVQKFSRRLGTQMGFFISEPNTGDYLIQLKKSRKRTTDEVTDDIRKKIQTTIPQLTADFGQVIGDMLGDLMSSVQPVEIKVFGDNQETIEDLSRRIAAVARKTPGTADVFDGIVIAGPEITVHPNVARLAQLSLTPNDLQFQLQTQIEGTVISTMLEREQRLDIRMIYPQANQTSLNSLGNTTIFLDSGSIIPIRAVADLTVGKGVAEINRENQKMMGVITARLDNRDLGSTLKALQKNIETTLHLPQGYHIEYGGSYAQQQKAFNELLTILGAACLLVFIVMLFLFRQIIISLIIMLLAAFGVSGSLLALFITGTPLNVGSYTGMIMIVGIIGENAIFTYWQYIEARKTMSSGESLAFSISVRLRPKLMTACGAIIALLPLAMGIGTGAQLHQPLAIAVIGGLIIALPLLLIVFPTIIRKTGR